MTTLTDKQIYNKRLKTYKQEFRKFLLTSRFNNKTWEENAKFREKAKQIGCVYCSPEQITQKNPVESINFVLEMNNDTNKILGIGMIRNHPHINKYAVYENMNYNRYVYIGKNRIDRGDMTDKEEEIMKFFDIICFTGNKHMKRGNGLKQFPTDIIYRCSKEVDLIEFINEMFKSRLQ
jgi:hypothetical protein